jgi:hypothetical protein
MSMRRRWWFMGAAPLKGELRHELDEPWRSGCRGGDAPEVGAALRLNPSVQGARRGLAAYITLDNPWGQSDYAALSIIDLR